MNKVMNELVKQHNAVRSCTTDETVGDLNQERETYTSESGSFAVEICENRYKPASIAQAKAKGLNPNMLSPWLCVYVHIYPPHPMFAEVNTERDSQDYSYPDNINFHGGCTYYDHEEDEKGIIVKKTLGCDYHHFGDENITRSEVETDINDLFIMLRAREASDYQTSGGLSSPSSPV